MPDSRKCFFDYTDPKTKKKTMLELEVFESVYEPQEDSFLVAQNVNVNSNSAVLEVGCGCGLVSVLAALQGAKVSAVDINPKAVECTRKNAQKYNVKINAFVSDLFKEVRGKYDYIFFNPPYLPVDKELVIYSRTDEERAEMLAVDGGKSGRKNIDRFLEQFPPLLNKNGFVYLLSSSTNNIEKTKEKIKSMNFNYDIIAESALFFEKLYLFKIWR